MAALTVIPVVAAEPLQVGLTGRSYSVGDTLEIRLNASGGTPPYKMKLYVSEQVKLTYGKNEATTFPASSITEISYGQDVHRRIGAAIGIGIFTLGIGALMALVKSKKHFIGITWDDAGKKGGVAFQADKGDYRGIIAGLEGLSGKKVVNTDAMAVKN